MKTIFAALAALSISAAAGAAKADAFEQAGVPGYIFVKADQNNDGRLNEAERSRADFFVYLRDRSDND